MAHNNGNLNISDLISISEAARLRGVAHATIQDLIGRGKLAAVDVGGRRFLSREEVKSYQPGVPGRPPKNSVKKARKGAVRHGGKSDKRGGRRS
jgi:excisionase family DNA binding protein